ncbi:hypothetical protein BTGOE4_10260 [Bacillus thuringiensis]|uniref:Uncharacterized protein n=1 Tax=Bacillus thuringiensis TaxID=1428 RepID=A0A9X5RQK4_BACTU|nr:hypothetical protein [Bacillus thuringiensis]OFC94636.1 hypothetical protein BTGOE4_10260 [Bacillus thuringiensis]
MTWLSFFIGYCVGMTICLLIMIQFIKVKEENKFGYDIDDSVHKEMEQLKAIRKDKLNGTK